MDFDFLINAKRARFDELESLVASPGFYDNPSHARELMREHSRTKEVIETFDALAKAEADLAGNRELIQGDDAEFAEMAKAEIPALEASHVTLTQKLQILLLPPDPNDDRDAIVEIRAGTGGQEAALFAADLLRMYVRYAETKGLRIEDMETSESDLGGLKEVIFRVTGEQVFRILRYESGVHRVQRVPATETQGRIHTSTATVAVLPEAEEVEFELRPEDLRIEVCRAGGPGGQGVNTTDSAVQVFHIPTGKMVRCQDGRSQQKNKEKALNILRARLLEEKQREEAEKYSAHRKSQIGSGGREEKIRTYNYRENRVTDHRINRTQHNLDLFMQGDLDDMLEALQLADLADKIAEAKATLTS